MTTVVALRTFVEAYRALTPAPSSLPQRLATFVERWQALSPTPPLPIAAPTPTTVATLAPVIARLGPALERARATGASVNIWQVAGLGRDERRNAEALAWLLNPRGSHGLGPEPLRAFFAALQFHATDVDTPPRLETAVVRTEHRPMNSERDRVDIVIEHSALLLFLEVKIDAGPGDRQLERYLESAQETARCTNCATSRVVLLTKRRVKGLPPEIISIFWRDLASTLHLVAAKASHSPHVSHAVSQLLRHFDGF